MKNIRSKNKLIKIGYDPIYNFHLSYHGSLIFATNHLLKWIPGNIINNSEKCIRSQDRNKRKNIFNSGYFSRKSATKIDIIFSPHILLESSENYVVEIEDIWWLFGDKYEDLKYSTHIPSWKIEKFCYLICKDNLKHIFWWSDSAIKRFKVFSNINNISKHVIKVILSKSSVLYPCSMIIQNKVSGSVYDNKFIGIFNRADLHRKGGDAVINSFVKLYNSGIKNWTLDIYGDNINNCKNLLPKNVNLHEKINHSELIKKFSKSSILLFFSRADTFGTVLVEAINNSMSIIATAGKSTFASKEILSTYPNKIIINSKLNDGIFDIINFNRLYNSIKNIIKTPKNVFPFESKFTTHIIGSLFIKKIRQIV